MSIQFIFTQHSILDVTCFPSADTEKPVSLHRTFTT